ncbi:MAG TPA: phosphoadenylyl-sulfate reductase [Burkholderiaceae bacterium]|nr:phosphoadenylyl-sulfate reductase [Burkholderiaceae bacterium]
MNTPAKQSKAQNAKTRYAQTTASYADKLKETQDLLRQAAIEHAGSITQANSLGAEDVVIAHLIRALRLDIPAFVLETGQLNPETLVLLDKFKADWGSNFTVYQPRQEAVVHFVAKEGEGAMYRSIALRKACCDLRKMEPLARALSGKSAWITGLRREQSGARAEVPLLDDAEQASKGRVKFNPLANWTWGEVWYYIELHQLAYNSLHDEHVPSVGCAPCTRAIAQGEDFRAGRWWWEDESAKECGLHVRKKSEQV